MWYFSEGATLPGQAATRGVIVVAEAASEVFGVMLLEGEPAILDCLEMVDGRDGRAILYSHWRFANAPSSPGAWQKVDGLAVQHEVIDQVMIGHLRSATSEDLCGAAGVPATVTAARFSITVDGYE